LTKRISCSCTKRTSGSHRVLCSGRVFPLEENKERLEDVQRAATKIIIVTLPYEDRLTYLGLTNLEERMGGDLIETYTITCIA